MPFSPREYAAKRRREEQAKRPDALCACGCGKVLPKTPRGRKWLTRACCNRATSAKRLRERRASKPERHPAAKYIYEALQDTPQGLCPWCDNLLPPGYRMKCKDPECEREYMRAYGAGRRELKP